MLTEVTSPAMVENVCENRIIFSSTTWNVDVVKPCSASSQAAPLRFIIIRIYHDEASLLQPLSSNNKHSFSLPPTLLRSLQGSAPLHGPDWIFIKTHWILDDTRASAHAQHMHEMCINMVLFPSRWSGEWLVVCGPLNGIRPVSGQRISCNWTGFL